MASNKNPQNNHSYLWQKFRHGDYAKLGEIFQILYKELYFYGLKLVPLPDLVKDTIQDIFVTVWARRQKMGEVENIKTYFFVSIRRELLRRIIKLRKEGPIETSHMEPFIFSNEDFIVKEENEKRVTQSLVQCLSKLTEKQREVIQLRFNHEMEFREIAEVMEMNIQSVRNLLFRALENIRKEMKDIGIEGASDTEIFLLSIFRKNKNDFFS